MRDVSLESVVPQGGIRVTTDSGVKVWTDRSNEVSFRSGDQVRGSYRWEEESGTGGSRAAVLVTVRKSGSPWFAGLMHRQLHGRAEALSAFRDEPKSDPRPQGTVMGRRVSGEELICGSDSDPCDSWYYKAYLGQYRFRIKFNPDFRDPADTASAVATIRALMESMLENIEGRK